MILRATLKMCCSQMAEHLNHKFVLVHLGPHKTGSITIQQSLAEGTESLAKSGIHFLHNAQTHASALDLSNNRYQSAEERLCEVSATISKLSEPTVILSQEEFCGALIGWPDTQRIYPRLTKHLRIFRRALRQHQVKFIFFRRAETEWLRSCYHQDLKFSTRFYRFDDFSAHFGKDFSWDKQLEKPIRVFGENLVVEPYGDAPEAGIEAVLNHAGASKTTKNTILKSSFVRNSQPAEQIAQLERINEMSEFHASAWFAKSFFLKNDKKPQDGSYLFDPTAWPPAKIDQQPQAMPRLATRVQARVQHQKIDDILPPPDVDLDALSKARLPKDVEMPDLSRSDIRNQSIILNYHLRGKSKLSHLNALTISYLRRDTDHTKKARALFHRIWREQGPVLVNELSTRWLISTLQTFLDHGENEAQRMIGTAGYFYGNMMKIYEGERAIEGREQDTPYEGEKPQTKNQFRGMDRYHVGGSDLMLNTNALALEFAQRDATAGLVLQEFLLRVKSAETVFSRHDRTRKSKNINVKGFENTWSFFEPWN